MLSALPTPTCAPLLFCGTHLSVTCTSNPAQATRYARLEAFIFLAVRTSSHTLPLPSYVCRGQASAEQEKEAGMVSVGRELRVQHESVPMCLRGFDEKGLFGAGEASGGVVFDATQVR